ncbi:MAG TPA: plastocyanin/azurin family copper-binding protein [Capillimicrobium sp.]|nr:plastocyanin/azurin family copper-binding protein [Capillimicrobium sp.]
MRRTFLPLLAVLALVAAGCGGDDDESAATTGSGGAAAETTATTGGAAAPKGKGETVTVDMVSIQFDPKTVEVEVGDTVRWVNQDTVDHDAVSTSGDEFASDQFGKGGTFEYTTEQPGTIEYECTLHPGMVGTIEVR